jgi:26S proteasome regulatory subunit N3
MFINVLDVNHAQFQQDRTYILIQRLRHNVIKTGLRAISSSYSKISLADAAHKLVLDAPEDAEFIVAKVKHSSPMPINIKYPKNQNVTAVSCT